MEQEGDYGLNIDTDLALWLDSRDFHKNNPPLHRACGFVIINSQVHDDFNKFKKVQAQCDYSLLESVELLDLWNSSRNSPDAVMNRFGKQYIRLHRTDIESLCKWVMELRESFERLGKVALQIHNTESSATSSLQHLHKDDQIACLEELPAAPSATSKEGNIRVLTKTSGSFIYNYYN